MLVHAHNPQRNQPGIWGLTRRFGAPLSISGNQSGIAERAELHALPQGGFIATWYSYAAGGFLAQTFNARGRKVGAANTLVGLESDYWNARCTIVSDGKLLIVSHKEDRLQAQYYDPKTSIISDPFPLVDHLNKELSYLQRSAEGGYALTRLINPMEPYFWYFNWSPIYETLLFNSSNQLQGQAVVSGNDQAGWKLDALQVAPYVSGGILTIRQEQREWPSWSPEANTRLLWQRFDANGVSAGPTITVQESSWLNISFPHAIASLSNGRVAVLWSDYDESLIRTQVFTADGRKIGRQFVVEGVTLNRWNPPRLSPLPDGGFVATWGVADPGGGGRAIGGLRFDSRGRPGDASFLVNQPSQNFFEEITITPLIDGRFVVGWTEANMLFDPILDDPIHEPEQVRHWQIRGQILDGRNNPIRLHGTAGNDDFIGTQFADRMFGNDGNDRLRGGAGRDILSGGGGNDTLTGGSGPDRFRFTSALDASSNCDTITDFSIHEADTIQLDRSVFTALATTGTLAASSFVIGAIATTSAQNLHYDPSTGVLAYDPDGHGDIAPIAFAKLTPGLALTISSFTVI
jgi:hypothetical protein